MISASFIINRDNFQMFIIIQFYYKLHCKPLEEDGYFWLKEIKNWKFNGTLVQCFILKYLPWFETEIDKEIHKNKK